MVSNFDECNAAAESSKSFRCTSFDNAAVDSHKDFMGNAVLMACRAESTADRQVKLQNTRDLTQTDLGNPKCARMHIPRYTRDPETLIVVKHIGIPVCTQAYPGTRGRALEYLGTSKVRLVNYPSTPWTKVHPDIPWQA